MLYLFVLSFLLFCNSILVAMEQQNKEIILEDAQGVIFTIPEEEAVLFGVIKKWNEESDDLYDEDDERQFSLHGTSFFTQENFELLVSMVKNKDCDVCGEGSIKPIFLLADSLEAPEETIKELSQKAWGILPLKKINKKMSGLYTYLTSIATIPHELSGSWRNLSFASKQICCLYGIKEFANEMTTSLNLSNNQLRAIDIKELLTSFPNLKELVLSHNQLEQLESPDPLPAFFELKMAYNKLTELPALDSSTLAISLTHNCLRVLNIKKLLKKYPNLEELDFSYNQLEEVKWPSQLPDFFVLNLAHNNLTELPAFKVKEGCVVNLSHNPLSVNARTLALNAIKGNYTGFLKGWYRLIFYSADPKDYFLKSLGYEGCLGVVVAVISWCKTFDVLKLVKDSGFKDYLSYNVHKTVFIRNPDSQYYEMFHEIWTPADTTFLLEVKKYVTNGYVTSGLVLGLAGAWAATNYSRNYDSKKYKKSKIIV